MARSINAAAYGELFIGIRLLTVRAALFFSSLATARTSIGSFIAVSPHKPLARVPGGPPLGICEIAIRPAASMQDAHGNRQREVSLVVIAR
jgi:hypothetical protein